MGLRNKKDMKKYAIDFVDWFLGNIVGFCCEFLIESLVKLKSLVKL